MPHSVAQVAAHLHIPLLLAMTELLRWPDWSLPERAEREATAGAFRLDLWFRLTLHFRLRHHLDHDHHRAMHLSAIIPGLCSFFRETPSSRPKPRGTPWAALEGKLGNTPIPAVFRI